MEAWKEARWHRLWQAWRARLSPGQMTFSSLLQVTDDCTHCHFMAPPATLNGEICEIISRGYISHKTRRSLPICYEFYGGSHSYSVEGWGVCVRVTCTERKEERWNKSHNQLDKWSNILCAKCRFFRFMSLGRFSCSALHIQGLIQGSTVPVSSVWYLSWHQRTIYGNAKFIFIQLYCFCPIHRITSIVLTTSPSNDLASINGQNVLAKLSIYIPNILNVSCSGVVNAWYFFRVIHSCVCLRVCERVRGSDKEREMDHREVWL